MPGVCPGGMLKLRFDRYIIWPIRCKINKSTSFVVMGTTLTIRNKEIL